MILFPGLHCLYGSDRVSVPLELSDQVIYPTLVNLLGLVPIPDLPGVGFQALYYGLLLLGPALSCFRHNSLASFLDSVLLSS